MKERQQIVHIHGGNSFLEYEDYIEYLKKREYDPGKKKQKSME